MRGLSTRRVAAARSTPRTLLYGLAGLITAGAALWSLLLGYADQEFRRGERDNLARALSVAPFDAGYLAQWSLLAPNGDEAVRALEKSVHSDPWYSWSWIHLGLAAENDGNRDLARRDLLRAAAVDRGFAPRWALCNYFLRSGDTASFWYWSKEALTVTETDFTPVLRLAWRVAPDVPTILRRAIPARDAARRAFLLFLINEHPLQADFSEAPDLFSAALPDDVPVADRFIGKLVSAGKVEEAVQSWNVLCARHLLPFQEIRPADPNLLTNARFTTAPSARTFDWQLTTADGIVAENHPAAGELEVRFSGSEPERWLILSQRIPVQPGREYEFRFKTAIAGAKSAHGLRWKIYEGDKRDSVLAQSEDLGLADGPSSLRFTANASLVTLAFDFIRPRGTTRFQGTATISELSLSGAPKQ